MAVGDVYRFTLLGDFLGQACQNVLHYKVISQVGFDPTAADFVAQWETNFLGDWLDLHNVLYTLTGSTFQRILTSRNDPVYSAAPPASVGTVAGDALPSYVAFVISLRTGAPTRSGRGRIFLGGQSEASLIGNVYQAAYITDVQTFFVAASASWNIVVGANTQTVQLAVYSRVLNTASVVSSGLVDDNPGTMRSRKAGRGI